jgi:hypothetical protein
MKAIFQQYLDAEDKDEEEIVEPTRRKIPQGKYHDTWYEETLKVDHTLMTGNKSYKRAKKTTELQKYYDSHYQETVEAADESPLFKDPLAWWVQVGRYSYPLLFKIALDFLSIPCTSCECERAFSGSKRTVSDDRNKLSGSTIEALQLQKNWLKRGVVASELNDLAKYIQSQNALYKTTPLPPTPTVTRHFEA